MSSKISPDLLCCIWNLGRHTTLDLNFLVANRMKCQMKFNWLKFLVFSTANFSCGTIFCSAQSLWIIYCQFCPLFPSWPSRVNLNRTFLIVGPSQRPYSYRPDQHDRQNTAGLSSWTAVGLLSDFHSDTGLGMTSWFVFADQSNSQNIVQQKLWWIKTCVWRCTLVLADGI